MSDQRLGKIKYDGYCAACPTQKTWDGKPLPTWEQLGEQIRAQWQAGAESVLSEAGDVASSQPSTSPVPTSTPPPGRP